MDLEFDTTMKVRKYDKKANNKRAYQQSLLVGSYNVGSV